MARDLATTTTPTRRLGPRGGDRVRSTSHGLSKVDAALLGAALVILGERVSSASGTGSPRFLPAGLKPVSADQNFELSLSSLRNANAEVSLLSSLVSSVRKNVSEELSVSKTAQAVSDAYSSKTQLTDDLEQYLADAGRPVSATELGVDGNANVSGKSYISEMESLESASQEFLNIMRQLFAEELDSVAERQQQKPAEEQQEVAKEDAEKKPEGELEQEVADDDGLGSPWMGLLGLAGGGGGGGGFGGGGGGGFGIGGGVVDGYVSGATVFWDINSNFIMDANESAYSTTTAADGSYSLNITSATGQIVVMDDGVDISTGGSVGMMAMSLSNASDVTAAQITPLTMLAAQGISDDDILTMLGYDPAASDISIHTLDPVELLESGTDAQTGGTLLLKAQQIFAITNAVAAVAEEAGMTQAAAVSATLDVFGELSDTDLAKLVGDMSTGGDAANAVIQQIITDVMTVAGATDFAESDEILAAMANSIVNANELLGEIDPTEALGESARAAALITQNDLVTEFRAVGQMDPSAVPTDIAERLTASFGDVNEIRANFQDVYKAQIADSLDASGGIITAVDDVTISAGLGQRIAVSDIIANDLSTGSGDLVMVAVTPALVGTGYDRFGEGLGAEDPVYAWTTMSEGSETVTVWTEPGQTLRVFDGETEITGDSIIVESADGAYSVSPYGENPDGLSARELSYAFEGPDGELVLVDPRSVEHEYRLEVPSPDAWTPGDYVVMDIGPIKVQTRYADGDDPSTLAARLAQEARSTLKAEEAPFTIETDPESPHTLIIRDRSGEPLYDRKTGDLGIELMKASDPFAAVDGDGNPSGFGARIVTGEDGLQYVEIDSTSAASVKLKYTLANDDGQGHGLIRLTVEPDFRELVTANNRLTSVVEDAYTHTDGTKYTEIDLGTQFGFSGPVNDTTIKETLVFRLGPSMPDGCRLRLSDTGELVSFARAQDGSFKGISIDLDNPPSLLMPTNYHGDVDLSFALLSRVNTTEGAVFTDRSDLTGLVVSVTPDAEAPEDQANLEILIGDDATVSGDLEGSIVPVVNGEPSPNQTTRLKLTGGDPNETHSLIFYNIPDGMNVYVDESLVSVRFGSFRLDDVGLETELGVRFEASEALLGSQFGLTDSADPIRAVVVGSEVSDEGLTLDSAQGGQVSFLFDIGGTYGLTVTSQALTVAAEDVAALVGSLDASIGDGAVLETEITISDRYASLGRYGSSGFVGFDFIDSEASDGEAIYDVQFTETVDGVETDRTETITVTRQFNPDGTATYVLDAPDSSTAAVYLEGLAVLPGTEHFKGTLTASASFTASKIVTDSEGNPVLDTENNPVTQTLASLSRGPLSLRFDPVPDGVASYDTTVTELSVSEDHGVALASLFLSSGETIAQKIDADETLVYEVSDIPATARLVDGSGFYVKDEQGELVLDDDGAPVEKTGAALANAIANAPLIGRVVGDAVQLSASQAAKAHLVVAADQHLDLSTLTLNAFTREPLTGDQSDTETDTVDVSITAVADKPYVSFDESFQTRGLVDVYHTAESGVEGESYLDELGLADKAQISLPVTMALEDLDGSESLWVWLTPYSYGENGALELSPVEDFNFSTSADPVLYDTDDERGALVVKASEFDSVLVSRSSEYGTPNGFDGVFRVEVVAIEGAVDDQGVYGDPPATALDAITRRDGGVEGVDYAIPDQDIDLKVEFLQPATKPTLDLTKTNGEDSVELTLRIGPDNVETDIVTILATGVPAGASFVDSDGDAFGARAEVDGVWVLPANKFGPYGSPSTVTLKLPPEFDGTETRTVNEVVEYVNVVDFTAYAVDSLGLTSAASDKIEFTPDVVTGATVADPIVVDLSGDGVLFTELTGTDGDGRPKEFFDINGDGSVDRLTGWLSPDGDDAFLVALDTDQDGNFVLPASLDGSYLFTEHLVSPASSNAAEDLASFEENLYADNPDLGASDGVLTAAELELGLGRSPFLWFDRDSDGRATADEIETLGADFSIDVGGFDDVVVTDSVTGAQVVASTGAGSLSGTYSDLNLGLGGAVLRDVFLPVAPADASASVVEMADSPITLSGAGFTEDNPDGFELKAALADPAAGLGWHDLFGVAAAAAIDAGTSVLLSVRAKNAGTYFNLSQGARLEGQPTDTWLTIWDGQSPSDEFSLRMFVADNLSGDIPLELRATVVYTDNGLINESTVTRDLTVAVSPEAERALVAAPDKVITTDPGGETIRESGSDELSVALSGITARSPDPGETVITEIRASADTAAKVDLTLNGVRVSAVADPEGEAPAPGEEDGRDYIYMLSGPISDGALGAIVDTYASGTFNFTMDVTTFDGDSEKSVSGLSFGFKVVPVAQAAVVELSADGSVEEGSGSIGFDVTVTPQDTDGSEFVSELRLVFEFNGTIHDGTEDAIALLIDGTVYAVTGSDGIYSATVPGDAMNALAGDTVGAKELSGQLLLPDYFDGTVDLSATAVTVESAKLTEKETSFESEDSVAQTVVSAVSDGIDEDGLVLTGVSKRGGEEFSLADVLSVEVLDPDETVSVTLTGVPDDAVLTGGVRSGSVWTIAGIVPGDTDLSAYKIQLSDMQDDFSLSVSVSTVDDTVSASSAVEKTLFVAVSPLYTPEFVDGDGNAIESIGLVVEEDGTGSLFGRVSQPDGSVLQTDLNVLVGGVLNPSTASIEITIPTTEPKLTMSLSGGSAVPVVTNTAGVAVWSLTAAELARGVEFGADPDNPNQSGVFEPLSIKATATFGVETKSTDNIPVDLTIAAVTDGVDMVFSGTQEGQPVSFEELLSRSDTDETIDAITVGQSSLLELRFTDPDDGTVTTVSLADGPYALDAQQISSLSSVQLVPLPYASGSGSIELSVTTVDHGKGEAPAASPLTQTQTLSFEVTPVANKPLDQNGADWSDGINILSLYADADGTPLTEAIVNDGRTDLGENIFVYLSAESFSSPDPSESVSAVLSGSGIVSGAKLVVSSGLHQGSYLAEDPDGTGNYSITVPGEGNQFSGLDGVLEVPKQSSGYGSKTIRLTAQTSDGDDTNVEVFENEDFSVFSTIPPSPFVQLSSDINVDDLRSGQIALTDLVRVAQGNDSHILELFDLPAGTEVQVVRKSDDGTETTVSLSEISFRSSNEGAAETGYRVAFTDWANTTIILTDAVRTGAELLSVRARVGTSDGIVNGAADGDTRYVYSRLVETELSLGGQGTAANDSLVNADGSAVVSGDGDDTVIVTNFGSGALDGGSGRDTLNLGQLSVADGAIVDLNDGSMTVVASGVTDQSQVYRKVDGFEVVVGTPGGDVIVGSGVDTESLTLRGEDGDDRIYGGAGDDLIDGGAGDDILAGGSGADRFVVAPSSGTDTVIDFDFAADSIVITGFGLSSPDSGALPPEVTLNRTGGEGTDTDWVLRVDNGTLTAALVLAGSSTMADAEILEQITGRVSFSEALDLDGSDPEAFDPDYGVDLGRIVGDPARVDIFTAETAAGSSFDSAYLDYTTLTDGDEVTADIAVGSVNLTTGDHWTQTDIDNLADARAAAIAADGDVIAARMAPRVPSEYVDSFFGALSFAGADLGDGVPDHPDDPLSIENALSVIADAKFESALIAKFTKDGDGVAEDIQHNEQSISGYLADYIGLSGSIGHDVLIGLDQDSVLYGGDGGSDRIFGGLGDDILISTRDRDGDIDELTGGAGADVFAFVSAGTVEAGLKNVHDVLVNDFNRDEGDRLLLVGYDDPNDVVIHDVDVGTNTQRVSLEDGLTVMFDLSFAREFDTNFALRLADFDKFEG